jgi:acetate kinase
MSLTPLDGLPGATRSGAIDPSLIFHYTNKAGKISHSPNVATQLHVTQARLPYPVFFVLLNFVSLQAEEVLNFESGWKSLTGTTDFGEISKRTDEGSEPDRLAFDLFADRIMNYVGAYHLKLGGKVDALVFSGGIGEKAVKLRKVIGDQVVCLGYPAVDDSKNNECNTQEGVVIDITGNVSASVGPSESQRRIFVCRTDEEVHPLELLFSGTDIFSYSSWRWHVNAQTIKPSGPTSSCISILKGFLC